MCDYIACVVWQWYTKFEAITAMRYGVKIKEKRLCHELCSAPRNEFVQTHISNIAVPP